MKTFAAVWGLCVSVAAAALLGSCVSQPTLPASTVIERTVKTGVVAPIAFDLTSTWINRTFNSPRAMLKKADKRSGSFAGRSWSDIDDVGVAEREIDYDIDIQISDGSTQFRFRTLYVMETHYEMRKFIFIQDEPLQVRIRRVVTQASFESFSQLVNKMMTDYQMFMSEQTKRSGS